MLVLFDSKGGWVSIKANILSICPTSVFICTFHDPLSAQTIGFIAQCNLAVNQSKTFIYPTQLAVSKWPELRSK